MSKGCIEMINSKIVIRGMMVVMLSLVWLAVPRGTIRAADITIDGNFGDWAGKDAFTDREGADESGVSPSDLDVTEYRAYADSSGVYLLMAWDDTSFNNASQVGVTVHNFNNLTYYRIYSAANKITPPVNASTLAVYSCSNDTCRTRTSICQGVSGGTSPCTGAALASGTTWTDPFPRATAVCNGTNCNNLDTAAEMFIPWSLVGGLPGNNQMVFMQYGSYNNDNNPNDSVAGLNGITCVLKNGVYDCYPSDPTAVQLVNFSAHNIGDLAAWPAILMALLAGLAGVAWVVAARRGRM